MNGVAVIVLAKAPVPGRVKTRLCPPYTPREAAALARAALVDTLEVVAESNPGRCVLALDGVLDGVLDARTVRGFEVIPQQPGSLDARIVGAFASVGGPAVLVGMDTPQMTPALLGEAVEALSRPSDDAVLGLACDGGFWALGLRRYDSRAFSGIPMSTGETGARQRARLAALGLRTAMLPVLRDVDDADDAIAVAALAPHTRFAMTLAEIDAARATGARP